MSDDLILAFFIIPLMIPMGSFGENVDYNKADSMKVYRTNCELDQSGACSDAARLINVAADNTPLEAECGKGKIGDCLILGYAEKSAGQLGKAKEVFMRACNQGSGSSSSNAWVACSEASMLIPTPSDAASYIEGEATCEHWKGEDAYNPARAKEIEQGISVSCKDRSEELKRLRVKYRNNKDILFKLSHPSLS